MKAKERERERETVTEGGLRAREMGIVKSVWICIFSSASKNGGVEIRLDGQGIKLFNISIA